MSTTSIETLFEFDRLALVMMALVLFIGLCVASFAYRYLKGDTEYRMFFVRLAGLVCSVSALVSANHLLVLLAAWAVSNLLLVRLMLHTPAWHAARASARLAARTLLPGTAALAAAFALLHHATGQVTVTALLASADAASPMVMAALLLVLVAAMTQSAIWPMHRWLLSSLNAPTPVSAMMHAGLINGGGFLVIRFAPLYAAQPLLLEVMLVLGLMTALLGTLWKLVQSDVKRMLACSTMGQMGFMLAQCGLGLFPLALAHMCWHGMFKAYLFLASGGAAQEKRLDLNYPPARLAFAASLVAGAAGAYAFAQVSGLGWHAGDTRLLPEVLAGVAVAQFCLPLLRARTLATMPAALGAAGVFGAAYGLSVRLVEQVVAPLQLMQPQPLNALHLAALGTLVAAWLALLFLRPRLQEEDHPRWRKFYVEALNESQPHLATVTAHRNSYHYV